VIWAALLLVFGCESGGRDHSSAIKPAPPGVVATDVRVDVLDFPTLNALEAQGNASGGEHLRRAFGTLGVLSA
jgi:hypothetical protein